MEPGYADLLLDKPSGRRSALRDKEFVPRMHRLTAWMLILGTVRLIAALGDSGADILDVSPRWPPSWTVIAPLFSPLPVVILLSSGWPLLTAILVRRTSNPAALLAAAITFSILSVGGLFNLFSALDMRLADSMFSVGSFTVNRGPLWHGNLAAAIPALMGLTQLALELATAVGTWRLLKDSKVSRPGDAIQAAASGGSRKALYSRLAVYASLSFILIQVRQPVWSAYLTVLERSEVLRRFVLENDVKSRTAHHGVPRSTLGAFGDPGIGMQFSMANHLADAGHVREARQSYQEIIATTKAIPHDPVRAKLVLSQRSLALNNLAWILLTCEDLQYRDHERALSLAKQAVELNSNERMYWNTLGVAYFRVQQWDKADMALTRSMELSEGGEGDSHDWFVMAMIHARKNRNDEARKWYDRAVAWLQKMGRPNRELHRFHVEAASALGLPAPAPPMMTMQPGLHPIVQPVPGQRKSHRTSSVTPARPPGSPGIIRQA